MGGRAFPPIGVSLYPVKKGPEQGAYILLATLYFLLFVQFPLVLGPTEGTENIYLFFISYKLFA